MQYSKGFRGKTPENQQQCGFQGNITILFILQNEIFCFAHLSHNLHHTAESNKTAAPFIKRTLPHFRGKVFYIAVIVCFAVCKILYGIGWAFAVIHFYQAQDGGPGKTARCYHFGYMRLLQPLQPLFMNGFFQFDGNIVNDHAANIAESVSFLIGSCPESGDR